MENQIPDCFYRISVKALILDDQKRFLLSKEDDGFWEMPGGGLDFGETPHEGISREIYEEMGLKATYIAENPSYFLTCTSKKGLPVANIIYETRLEHLEFIPSSECQELRFFTVEEAKKELFHSSIEEFLKLYKA